MDKLWTPSAPSLIKTPTQPRQKINLPPALKELEEKINEELRGFGFKVQ